MSRDGLGHELGGVHRDTIGAWERGEWAPGAHNLPALASVLRLSPAELSAAILNEPEPAPQGRMQGGPGRSGGLRTAALVDVLDWGWTVDRLMEHLLELRREALGDASPGVGAGTPDHWAPIFAHLPDCWRLVVSRPGHVVANWAILPLRDDAYERVLAGDACETDITPTDLAPPVLPGAYRAIAVGVVIRPGWLDTLLRALLFRSFVDALVDLASHGILFDELAFCAHTQHSKSLCAALQMRRVAALRRLPASAIFVLALRPPQAGSIFARSEQLRAAYASA